MDNPYQCLDCEHCYISGGDWSYSEYTPGGPGMWECYKKHFDLEAGAIEAKSVKAALLKGSKCKDFKPDESLRPL